MKIKAFTILAFWACVGGSYAGVGGGVGPYATALKGVGDYVFGAGVRGELTFNKYIGLEARVSYTDAADADAGIMPFEAGIVGIIPLGKSNAELFGCVGGGYYTITGDTTVGSTGLEMDPIFGFYGAAGLNVFVTKNIKLFIDIKYTSAKNEATETTTGGIAGFYTWTRTTSVEYGVDGVGGDIGVMFTF